ncbi:MAG TPA: hypothetical protein VN258_13345 [Mobilitalea sp.]|nr:hypothetical protein [Mobilitalea sp.]
MYISPIGATTYTYPAAATSALGQPVNAVSKVNGVIPIGQKSTNSIEKTKPSECQTCKNRKYMDQSNDNNVSFKSPAHVSPQASFAAVSSHEQEHVTNAVNEGNQPGNKLLSSSVSLKMAICPECGTPYIAGGATRTTIEYNTSNPYENARKSIEGSLLKGMNVDYVA